ncbi:MAG: ATP-dependent Clp protease adaptor ClpS [Planctomycetes bacterium]|nr:ATP-dependent Clp protease adaptor ClpS [Planctomycetota bacterium]
MDPAVTADIQIHDLTSDPDSESVVKTLPAPPRVHRLKPWDVLLHNDDHNEMDYVVETIVSLTALEPQMAIECMLEAHKSGLALLLSTHREHAELLQEQFTSKRLTVTIQPSC